MCGKMGIRSFWRPRKLPRFSKGSWQGWALAVYASFSNQNCHHKQHTRTHREKDTSSLFHPLCVCVSVCLSFSFSPLFLSPSLSFFFSPLFLSLMPSRGQFVECCDDFCRNGRVGQVDVHQADANHPRKRLHRRRQAWLRQASVPEHLHGHALDDPRHGNVENSLQGPIQWGMLFLCPCLVFFLSSTPPKSLAVWWPHSPPPPASSTAKANRFFSHWCGVLYDK